MTNPLRQGVIRRPLLLASLLCLALGALLAWQAQAQQDERSALVMTIEGAIGPAIDDYFQRGLDIAAEDDAELVVVQLDTPGGLDASMRAMISTMLASEVPVAFHVAPGGARAASAGTYLLYASHVAAMAPATHLGSATPVQLGGGGLPGLGDSEPSDDGEDEDTSEGEAPAESADEPEKRRGETAMERKVLEDAVAYIRSLAERHGRNADWAEEAVREAVSLGARQALEQNVIDVVADDIEALLAEVDGREVVMADGTQTLATADLTLERFDPDWRTELLAVITNPNVAYLLMIIGFYGLVFELMSPGALVPGTVGAVSLLLALFAFQVLPINYAGLGLILLGLGLIVGEALMPSFGILGIGGIVAFVMGSVMLMDAESLRISLPIIGGIALLAAGLMLWVVTRFLALRRRPPRTGQDELIGCRARVEAAFSGSGHVRLKGERWKARSAGPLSRDQAVRVTAVDGLVLEVEPLAAESN